MFILLFALLFTRFVVEIKGLRNLMFFIFFSAISAIVEGSELKSPGSNAPQRSDAVDSASIRYKLREGIFLFYCIYIGLYLLHS